MLKTSSAETFSSAALRRSQYEYDVAAPIRSPHVARYLGVVRSEGGFAVVEEAFGDRSLAEILTEGRLEVRAALHVAVQLARGLAAIHAHDVTHRAIHPGNVVVDSRTWGVRIIDFSEASVASQAADPARRLDGRAIPLAYISPEQTGRVNRAVDHRSDLYSLGATLYHVFTGRPPFEISDPLALVHAHIALSPRPASEVDPTVPEQLSRVIGKLLAKNAEDRYQSASGVAADLEECATQHRSTGTVAAFPLGRHDLPETLEISEKLYGRGAERAALLEAARAAAAGGKPMVAVSGAPGVGKSALVRDIRGTILEGRGAFASGKCGPLHSHVPYHALGQALGELCRGLLSLSEEELASWRARILERTGANAGLVAAFVPDLERVLGHQPTPPAIGPADALNRFHLTVAGFVSAFSSELRPLVLWLDDLQWADPATLHAMVALLRAPEPTHVLVIGSYRGGEVDAEHPLSTALDDLREASVDLRPLTLADLPREEVCAQLAETFHTARAEVRDLAGLVMDKTSGNPLFVRSFLHTLHEEKLVRFDPGGRRWTWDLRAIEALDVAPNVAGLLVRNLERLPPATRDALQIGACIGDPFEVDLIAGVQGQTDAEVRACLAPAVHERLIASLDPPFPREILDVPSHGARTAPGSFRFQHDLIRQAAYDGIPPAQRPEMHRALGRILLKRSPPQGRGDAVFAIVDQYDRGASLLTDPAERLELATLANEAGQRARAAAAYAEGLVYLRRGLALLPVDGWTRHYALLFALHLGCIECAYRSGRSDEAEALSVALLPRLRTAVDKGELYSIRVVLETNRRAYRRAIELGREALAELGHPVPEMKTQLSLLAAKAKVALVMRGRQPEDLAKLPDMTDRRAIAVVKILSSLMAPAYWTDHTLLYWAVHENLRLVVEYGIHSSAAGGFMNYGVILVARERDYARALAFGRLALTLAARPDAFALQSRTHAVFASFINAYAENSVRSCLPLLERAYRLGLESGDMINTCHAAGAMPQFMFMAGDPLDLVARKAEAYERAIRGFRFADMTLHLRIVGQAMRGLLGEGGGGVGLGTGDPEGAALLAEVNASPSPLPRAFYGMIKVWALAFFGEYGEVAETVLTMDEVIESANTGIFSLTEYGFLACIALVRSRNDPRFDPRAVERMLAKKRRLLESWAKSAPINFRHKHALVAAEIAESRGETDRAAALYDEAIRVAAANGFPQHAALASELAGEAYARRGLSQVARAYLEAARAGYAAWGASGKVRALDRAHPGLAPGERSSAALDVVGVVRASQALSDEISLPVLLERVMRVILQMAGARRATLLVEDQGRLRAEAHLDVEPGDRAKAGPGVASEAIVRYTLRTGEDVVLADASRSGAFVRDPYVVARGSKSILCMAVRHRDRVTGALFLENDASADVFTEERREVLRVVVGQAAISLQNAGLFEKLQEEVAERRRAESAVRFLANAGAELAESLDYGVTLAKTARLAVPCLADWCVIDLVDDDRSIRRVAGVHADPDKTPLLDQLRDRYPPTWNSRHPAAQVLRSAQPVVLTKVSDPVLTQTCVDGEHARLLRALGAESAMAVPLIVRDQVLGAMTLVLTTPERRYENESVALAVELARRAAVSIDNSRLYRDAQAAIGVRDEFLTVASHELRTPITSMLLSAEALEAIAPFPSEVARKRVNVIIRQTKRLQKLVDDLLGVSRADLGRLRENVREVDLAALAREVVDRFAEELGREGTSLSLRADRPVVGRWDPDRLDQVLVNLISNARKFGAGHPIEVEVEEVDSTARLTVRDRGIGIDPEALPHIFDRFGRAVSSQQYGGLGLGLYIVREIVRAHGGTVRVESTPGEGARFIVELPTTSTPR